MTQQGVQFNTYKQAGFVAGLRVLHETRGGRGTGRAIDTSLIFQ